MLPGKPRTGDPGSQETYLRPRATYPSRKGRLIHMITRNGTLAVLTAALVCAAPATAAAATKVDVRIEGKTKTLFEGPVNVSVHGVDAGDGSGPHKCDGT